VIPLYLPITTLYHTDESSEAQKPLQYSVCHHHGIYANTLDGQESTIEAEFMTRSVRVNP
jgi:hypothetical protein